MRREYHKEFGSFYYYENGRMLLMADEVAICFSFLGNSVVLHKHGATKDVVKWWEKNREQYRDLFGDLFIVESREWDPADLTECLERPYKIVELCRSIGRGIKPPGGIVLDED